MLLSSLFISGCLCSQPILQLFLSFVHRRWFPKLLRRQSSGGRRFHPLYRRVTIQEHLYPVMVPEFDKHLKKANGHIGRNLVEITIKMKTIVRKPLMIKINKLRFRNLDNQTPKEGRRTYRPKPYGNNNKDEDNSPKTLNDKNQQASFQKFRQSNT